MSRSASRKVLWSHAKVNLCLHVLGQRPDGYHELAMLMQQVSVADRICLTVHPQGEIDTVCPGLSLVDGEENITTRAARLLLQQVGARVGVLIEIDKQIPVAAGLGGGSSNAAAVLRGLNQLLGLPLDDSQLMELGLRLGADVPFFLFGRTAWATGIGECLQPWPAVPPHWQVLVNPGVEVSTAWVYQNFRLTRAGAVVKIPKFPEGVGALVRLLHNDLEPVTVAHYPVVDEIKQSLVSAGAEAALMSGSGPTVFGVFREREVALAAAECLAERCGWWVRVASPM